MSLRNSQKKTKKDGTVSSSLTELGMYTMYTGCGSNTKAVG